ncbi:restriction endonuclease subunit S, partial [Collinsella aerofaciens]|uniref:restriction endonuclease subunit S n=1 Tax=Collinsella aerofaciens TaxID=74426 RepID=UPI00319EB7B5
MTHVCLGDVAHEIKQKVPVGQELPTVGLEHLDPGEVELAHWDEGVETTFTKAFSKGQVLFGRRRAYLRKAAVAPFDGICSGDITVIAPKDNLSPRLLPFIIQNDALFEHAVTNSAGSLSPRVKWQSLSQFEFELPSIAKQEDLADILWTAQETRSHYRQLLTACDDVVKSQFVEMFGDPIDNTFHKPIASFSDL